MQRIYPDTFRLITDRHIILEPVFRGMIQDIREYGIGIVD
jgi:hypothetical protein